MAWIAVSDRLPTQAALVIGWNGTRVGEFTYGPNPRGKTKKERAAQFRWRGKPHPSITHWMHFPEPPK